VHDVIRLEALGLPTAAVGTRPFVDEALEQAALLGMADYRMVLIDHPIQLLAEEALRERAESAFGQVAQRLLARQSREDVHHVSIIV
jgi:hypothetical protein